MGAALPTIWSSEAAISAAFVSVRLAAAGVVRQFDTPPSGSHRYVVEQGFEMGRPSLITLEMDVEKGALAAARIGGDAVVVAEGTLAV